MKALIIAAGDGTRLGEFTKNIPKPLIPLNGKPLIEIIMGRCKNLGLKDFVIVTGYLGEKIKMFINEKFINENGINVEFVNNPDFHKENGISVYCAKDILQNEKEFLLIMADHIFDSTLLKKITNHKINEGCLLAIDKNLSNVFDLQEAMKVHEKNGEILDIGKNLKNYNAVDIGFFICTQDIFWALKQSIHKGFDKLSDAMKLLAKNKKLSAIDISGNSWLDIDTKMHLEFARKYFYEVAIDGVHKEL